MVPQKTNPAIKALVLGEIQPPLQCLALKILVKRLQLAVQSDKSPANIQKQVDTLYDFFVKNEAIARQDITNLFEKVAQ